jgi:hypothetical protein
MQQEIQLDPTGRPPSAPLPPPPLQQEDDENEVDVVAKATQKRSVRF